jgi:hypothetical protein
LNPRRLFWLFVFHTVSFIGGGGGGGGGHMYSFTIELACVHLCCSFIPIIFFI